MKAIIQNSKIAAVLEDSYDGFDAVMLPEGFDITKAHEFTYWNKQFVFDVQGEILKKTQERLDNFAKTRNYDNILSACTYAASTVPRFASDGQYCINLRDATWAILYSVLADVVSGARPMPNSFYDIETLLPLMEWPEV